MSDRFYREREVTPTPGAASELLTEIRDFLRQSVQIDGGYMDQNGNGEPPGYRSEWDQNADDYARELTKLIETTQPAPVMEGAQREAVAWPDILTAADFHFLKSLRVFITSREKIFQPTGVEMFDELMQRFQAGFDALTDPPDRVQPERVEAACSRCNGTGKIREESGSVYGGADIRKCPDCAPPTDASSHSTNSSEIDSSLVVSPPDASGGVTEEMVNAAVCTYLGLKIGTSFNPLDAAYQGMRKALEAADRARKPVDVSAQTDETCGLCTDGRVVVIDPNDTGSTHEVIDDCPFCEGTGSGAWRKRGSAQATSAGEPVAQASADDRKQVAAQYLVVAALARNLASVHADLAGVFVSQVPERMLDMLGERSAEIMETLGDILNGMDAAEETDSWMDPIFERAQERWPVAAPTPVAAYREVTLEDMRAAFGAWRTASDPLNTTQAALDYFRSIGAVILTPKDSTPNYEGEGVVKIPDPERP